MKVGERKENEAKYKLRTFKTIGEILEYQRKFTMGRGKGVYKKAKRLPKAIKLPLQ